MLLSAVFVIGKRIMLHCLACASFQIPAFQPNRSSNWPTVSPPFLQAYSNSLGRPCCPWPPYAAQLIPLTCSIAAFYNLINIPLCEASADGLQ
jgi:hypothetical protein